MSKRYLTFSVILYFVCNSQKIFPNTFAAYGVGRYTGQSGAGAAMVSDATAAYLNPAGLAFPERAEEFSEKGDSLETPTASPKDIYAPGSRENTDPRKIKKGYYHDVTIGFKQVLGMLRVQPTATSDWANKKAIDVSKDQNASLLELGGAVDFRSLIKTPWNIPVRIGFLLHLSADGKVAKPITLDETSYNFLRAGNNVNMLSATFSVGLQLWPRRLSIGVGQESKINLTGTAQVRNITLNEETPLYVNALVNVKAEPVPVIALLYRQPISKHDLFFTFIYRGRVETLSTLKTRLDLPLGFTTQAESTARILLLPHRFLAALALKYKDIHFMIDAEYHKWSDAELNPAVARINHPFTFSDILILRSGVDIPVKLAKKDWRIRFGYAHIPPYTPDQNSWSNYLDNRKHIFSLGGTFALPAWKYLYTETIVDISLQWQLWSEREVIKDGAFTFPNDTPQPGYTYGGNIFQIHCGFSWRI
ncbi:MAG: hypothetical protein LDLANPLL_02400 [Turneriella sp.]|nr:hypothetical protein [Turneriella sp.]